MQAQESTPETATFMSKLLDQKKLSKNEEIKMSQHLKNILWGYCSLH